MGWKAASSMVDISLPISDLLQKPKLVKRGTDENWAACCEESFGIKIPMIVLIPV